MPKYTAWSSATPTTVSRATTASGTTLKTFVQVATPSTCAIKPLKWWVSFGNAAAGVPAIVELIETDVAATSGTSFTPEKYSDPGAAASLCVGGTGSTGFGFTVEGTITATRSADAHQIAPTTQFEYEWVLNNEFIVARSKFLRIRIKGGVDAPFIAGVLWEEW